METYPNKNIYTYKKYLFTCRKCNWQGLGSETVPVDYCFAIEYKVISCPLCNSIIECIHWPTANEILLYGSEEQKKHLAEREIAERAIFEAEREAFHKEYPRPTLEQLPDITSRSITITLHEELYQGKGWPHCDRSFIVMCHNGKELWREPMGYEYYTTYLSIGKLLKEKYGKRLFDFECEYTVNLGGDCSSAFDKVEKFRYDIKWKRETK